MHASIKKIGITMAATVVGLLTLTAAPAQADTYFFLENQHPDAIANNEVLDLQQGNTQPNTPIITYPKHEVAPHSPDNQLWQLEPRPNRTVVIKTKLTDANGAHLCVVPDPHSSEGKVVLGTCDINNTNNRWYDDIQDNDRIFRHADTHVKCLTRTGNDQQTVVQDCNNSEEQQWMLTVS